MRVSPSGTSRRKSGPVSDIRRLLGERLGRRRRALGLDIAALESVTGASAGVLAAAERGQGDLSASLLFILARALDVSIDYFFEDVPAMRKAARKGIEDAEVRSFVAAYWAIRDARARRSVLALARAAAEEGPPA